jgi:hypothetical protein
MTNESILHLSALSETNFEKRNYFHPGALDRNPAFMAADDDKKSPVEKEQAILPKKGVELRLWTSFALFVSPTASSWRVQVTGNVPKGADRKEFNPSKKVTEDLIALWDTWQQDESLESENFRIKGIASVSMALDLWSHFHSGGDGLRRLRVETNDFVLDSINWADRMKLTGVPVKVRTTL